MMTAIPAIAYTNSAQSGNAAPGSVSFCGMTVGGRQLSKEVCRIAQREIPAYAGMTWEGAGVTRPGGSDVGGCGSDETRRE